MPLKEGSLEGFLADLQEIDETLRSIDSERNAHFVWDVNIEPSPTVGKEPSTKTTIGIALDFSDPRSLLVVSHERILPTSDWKMNWSG